MVQAERRLITWLEFEELVQQIAADVGQKPVDCIVGLTRGGLVPAVHLSHMFNAPLYTINVSLRDGKTGKDNFDWRELQGFKHILIVDDINDSGATFNYVLNQCYLNLVDKPKTAALLSKRSSAFEVTYAGEHINKEKENDWIVFPWE